jgi:hypothetical protein
MEHCGDYGRHYYNGKIKPESCLCGQIPVDIFFASGCDCGACRELHPVHQPGCKQIVWMEKRNKFIREHTINPPIEPVHYRVQVPEEVANG